MSKPARAFPRAAGAALLTALIGAASPAFGQVEVTVFAGRAFPTFEDRLVLRVSSVPSLPGVEVTPIGTPELRAGGGPVFGGALSLNAGFIGIEGRVDVTSIGFDVRGARYDLRATGPPFEGLTGSVGIGSGHLDVDRLTLVSVNLRVRTPGPVGLVASGGLSYLPDVTVTGSVPVSVQVEGLSVVVPSLEPRVTLAVAPGESSHRWGVNAGAGIRVGGRVSLLVEARVFYFRSYELRVGLEDSLLFVDEFLTSLDTVRFRPVVVNAQAGLTFRF